MGCIVMGGLIVGVGRGVRRGIPRHDWQDRLDADAELTPNATGNRLLKLFGKLPVKGTTRLTDGSPPSVIGGATHVFVNKHKP
jgi:hypothetical protein